MSIVQNGSEVSNRVLVFKALLRNPGGLTASQLYGRIRMEPSNGQMGVILRGEIKAGRLRVVDDEDGRMHYVTALGKRHLGAGRIDDWAREKHLVALGRGV